MIPNVQGMHINIHLKLPVAYRVGKMGKTCPPPLQSNNENLCFLVTVANPNPPNFFFETNQAGELPIILKKKKQRPDWAQQKKTTHASWIGTSTQPRNSTRNSTQRHPARQKTTRLQTQTQLHVKPPQPESLTHIKSSEPSVAPRR